MIKKFIVIFFSYLIITANVFSAGTDSSSTGTTKKLSSYDSAVIKINKAKKFEKKGKDKKAQKLYKEALKFLYKSNKEKELMDLMKELTAVKQKIEKRLKGRPLTS